MLLSACGMTYPTDAQIEHKGAVAVLSHLLVALPFVTYDTTFALALHVDLRDLLIDYWS